MHHSPSSFSLFSFRFWLKHHQNASALPSCVPLPPAFLEPSPEPFSYACRAHLPYRDDIDAPFLSISGHSALFDLVVYHEALHYTIRWWKIKNSSKAVLNKCSSSMIPNCCSWWQIETLKFQKEQWVGLCELSSKLGNSRYRRYFFSSQSSSSLSFDLVGICFSSNTFILICGLYNVAREGIPVSCFKEGRRSITVTSEPYIWNLQMGLWSSAHGTPIDFRVSYRRVITCLQFKRGCRRIRFLMIIIDKNWRKSRNWIKISICQEMI